MSDERKKVDERFKELRREIAEQREKLNEVNNEKEIWFRKKEELKKEVANSINEAKKLREEKEKINLLVKGFKEKREEQNSVTKERINRFKELKGKIIFKERGKTADLIKKEMEMIEERIETEALKFSEEKKLMKKIAKLRQEYNKAKSEADIIDEVRRLEAEIVNSKKKAEEFHKKVQELAGESKRKYEAYLEVSKKIKEINNEQENAFNNFLKFKDGFNKISSDVDNKLEEFKEIKNKIDDFKLQDKERKDEVKKKILIKKAEDVEEKLKKGEKLTTEDLIKFQGSKE